MDAAQWDPANRHPWMIEYAPWPKEQGFGIGGKQ